MIKFLVKCGIIQTKNKGIYQYLKLNPWNPFSYVVLVFIVLFVLFALMGSVAVFGLKHTRKVFFDVVQNPFTWAK